MGQFLEDLILFAIFFYIAKKVLRIVYTFITGNTVGRGNQGGQGSATSGSSEKRRPEGSINIKFSPEKKKSTVSDNEGTFIDYEDIKPK